MKPSPQSPSLAGAALLIVLGFLVLATVLSLAFFSVVKVESTTAVSYEQGVSTKQLADSALQFVMGTIREATSQGNHVAWASQPGMIRTYGTSGTASRDPLAYYKLYSSDVMVVSGASFPYDPFAADFDPNWRSMPAIWTDLNAPVFSSGIAEFPILEGKGIRLLTRNAAGETVPAYYGYDMDSNGLPDVDGFAIDPAEVAYNPAQPLAADNTPVPMPVRWIYVLNDGSLTVPDEAADGGRTARWSGAGAQPVPSSENPIVGRIAFWADDETSKLNLNTASEGGYWDAPRFSSAMDVALGRSGPAQREYNRYPGHPAGVSLSPVLGAALGLPQPTRFSLQPVVSQASSGTAGAPATYDPKPTLAPGVEDYLTRLFPITPRFLWGGSRMGTRPTAASITGAAGIARADLQLDRLYASVDEALYAPPSTGDTTRPLNPLGATPNLSPEFLNLARFFLTTTSRAPDVNPFNQPKIAMWPIDDPTRANPSNDTAGGLTDSRSPLDKTIAFASTINGNPYYFTRNDPMDPAGDFSLRNAQIYDYLVNRLREPMPGYGPAFSSRYPGKQTPQIVTGIYDFIRGAINISDSTAGGSNRYAYSFAKPFLDLPENPADTKLSYKSARPQVGQVVPFNHPSNDTKGTGRFPTIQQAVILFIATAANQPPLQVDPATGRPMGGPTGPAANPLHPFPNRVPTAIQISSTGSPAIFTINDAASKEYPTLSNQTHPGLRYLTTQNPATGAYDLPNPSYAGPALDYGQTQIQAILFFPMANPAAGNPALAPHYKLRVSGAGAFEVNGLPLKMRNGTKAKEVGINVPPSAHPNYDQPRYREITTSGTVGFLSQIMERQEGGAPQNLVFYSDKIAITNSTAPGSDTFAFTGGEITVEVLNPTDDSVVQTAKINFPNANFPVPILPTQDPYKPVTNRPGQNWASNPDVDQLFATNTSDLVSPFMLSFNGRLKLLRDWQTSESFATVLTPRQARIDTQGQRFKQTCETVRSIEAAYGDTRLTSALRTVPSHLFVPNRYYFDPEISSACTLAHPAGLAGTGGADKYLYVSRGSSIEGLMDFYSNDYTTDVWNIYHLLAANTTRPLPSGLSKFRKLMAHDNGRNPWHLSSSPNVTSSANFELKDSSYTGIQGWSALTPFATLWGRSGDYDSGILNGIDGPLINKPEEGMSSQPGSNQNPYFGNDARYNMVGDSVFSPNRQVASPVAFGSLPAGIDPDDPRPDQAYRTLLFSPNPNAQSHPSLGQNPPDSALLDFFQMPVVEPYAISESFSTAGKVNMNYRIAPFSYITRDSAIRGVLRGTQITAVEDRWIYYSKFYDQLQVDRYGVVAAGYNPFRYPIAEDDTLREFEHRFNQNDLFRSPSEISSIWLYPAVQPNLSTVSNPQRSLLNPGASEPTSHTAIRNWWYSNPKTTRKALTGDNVRETPYNHLYPRLTTKSNSFTVHVRVQKLQKIRTDPEQNTFKEDRDRITGEFRGSFSIERYIDPSDPDIPDFITDPTASLEPHYRFRVLHSKQFGN